MGGEKPSTRLAFEIQIRGKKCGCVSQLDFVGPRAVDATHHNFVSRIERSEVRGEVGGGTRADRYK